MQNGDGAMPGQCRPTQRHPKVMLVYATSVQLFFVVEGALRRLYPVLETIHYPVMRKPVQILAGRRLDLSESIVIWNGQKN